jgi:hypothetical protein
MYGVAENSAFTALFSVIFCLPVPHNPARLISLLMFLATYATMDDKRE